MDLKASKTPLPGTHDLAHVKQDHFVLERPHSTGGRRKRGGRKGKTAGSRRSRSKGKRTRRPKVGRKSAARRSSRR